MSQLDRRAAFQKLATVATVGGVIGAVSVPTCQAAPVPKDNPKVVPNTFTMQTEWRWCKKCEGLFFTGNGTNGVCPAGEKHDPSESGQYAVQVAKEGGQSGWRRCKKCEGLFFVDGDRRGTCPAGKEHDPLETIYTLSHNGT